MIEPYASAVKSVQARIEALGFSLQKDDEYGMTFVGPERVLDVETEHVYHPSITIALTVNGVRYSVTGIEDVLAPAEAKENQQALRAIKEKYDTAHLPIIQILEGGSASEYATVALDQLARFLTKYKPIIFDHPEAYRDDYRKWAQGPHVSTRD